MTCGDDAKSFESPFSSISWSQISWDQLNSEACNFVVSDHDQGFVHGNLRIMGKTGVGDVQAQHRTSQTRSLLQKGNRQPDFKGITHTHRILFGYS